MYAMEHQDSSNFPKAVLWQHERTSKARHFWHRLRTESFQAIYAERSLMRGKQRREAIGRLGYAL